MTALWRSLAGYLAKAVVAGGLLYWLAASGRLNLNDLKLFYSRPELLALTAAVWLGGPILLGGLRWRLLLGAAGLQLSLLQVGRLQFIAAFFNLALPSSLGGDGARFFYAPRRGLAAEGPRLLLSLAMDRFCGMCGLFFAAAGAMLTPGAWQVPALAPLTNFVLTGSALIVLGLVVYWTAPLSWLTKLWARLNARLPQAARAASIYEALMAYKAKPAATLTAIAISVTAHVATLLYLRYLTLLITGQAVPFATLASVVPVATLITAVPLAPGGLGVGHLAFEQLFQLAGLSGGANVYNLSALGQMAMNLLGAVPFFATRRAKGAAPAAEERNGNEQLAAPPPAG